MQFIKSTHLQSGEEIKISYKDYGKGTPVVLIHGWPVSKEMWEYQLDSLISNGCRVIKYDRRGFGKSDKPWDGYDYDSFAHDLNNLLEQLELQDVTLVGFSMGGGEIARYFANHNGNRVSKVVLISSILPFMLKTDTNPEGVDGSVFDKILEGLREDRIGFLDEFGKDFFGVGLLNKPVSAPYLQYFRGLAEVASGKSTIDAAKAFSQTDFREDMSKINVPTLIIHGDADKTVPIEASSDRTAKLLSHASYIRYAGAPHGLFFTHKEDLNSDLVEFITGRGSV